MSVGLLSTYIAMCVVMAVTPGPNMALIIANTLRGGFRAGFVTLIGTTTGLAMLVGVVVVGMTSIMVFMAQWFDVIRWAGAVYLVYLGGRQLWQYWRGPGEVPDVPKRRGRSLFLHGLVVALSNPKVLLFLGAFLPQFVAPDRPAGMQLALLGLLFVVTLALVDLMYTVAIARARSSVSAGRLRVLDAVSGVMLVAGGVLLAGARRA